MASQYKTRCPHCAAQFKITDEHLEQARGAVRCGSCLQIFQASDYLIDPADAQQQPQKNRWAGALDGSDVDNNLPKNTQTLADDDIESLSIHGMELSDSFMNVDVEDTDLG
ncbi:MJ0042-type zinc finger domain-containing protein, partial [Alcanivorax sp.]|uniref:MJ0042-type zinc finger domain-containing protein n=1 Tax=Alcanivorax sp. TaxID=1872427 RepID=UPI00258EC295